MKIWFDGGCRPNPGPMVTAVVMAGQAHIRTDHPHGDNNDAEWRALLDALRLAREAGVRDAVLIGDSALVIAQAGGTARRVPARFQGFLAEFQALAARFGRVRLRRTPRAQNLAGIALERHFGRL